MARLALGTVQFGMAYGVSNARGQVPAEEARTILRRAHAAGMRVLDTAAAYGEAEQVLAAALGGQHDFRVVTKTLTFANGLPAVEARARRSAALLGEAADALLVHAANDLASDDGAARWRMLERLRDEGLFRRIGISAYAADAPLALAKRFRPDLMQVPVSLLDQRLITDGTLEGLRALGIEVHARSVFLQGLLLMQPGALPPKLAYAAPVLREIQTRIAASGGAPLAAALGFILNRPEIDFAVVGVTGLRELEEILDAAAEPSPRLDWAACALHDPLLLTPSLW